mmetsp:Transcript_85416/g.170502  ORF Transcript_85416/g.170502 Transcript_85416/m.170502 type:complete len:217 (+) Transcript_85416:201-851(+)
MGAHDRERHIYLTAGLQHPQPRMHLEACRPLIDHDRRSVHEQHGGKTLSLWPLEGDVEGSDCTKGESSKHYLRGGEEASAAASDPACLLYHLSHLLAASVEPLRLLADQLGHQRLVLTHARLHKLHHVELPPGSTKLGHWSLRENLNNASCAEGRLFLGQHWQHIREVGVAGSQTMQANEHEVSRRASAPIDQIRRTFHNARVAGNCSLTCRRAAA